jgi:hypothetical protein
MQIKISCKYFQVCLGKTAWKGDGEEDSPGAGEEDPVPEGDPAWARSRLVS